MRTLRSKFRSLPHALLAGIVAFLIPWIHGPASQFIYDAAQYWGGAAALVAGEGPVVPGGLATRGVFTTFVYIPPAIATALIGPEATGWAVLAWNALLGAALCVLLIPRLARLLLPDFQSRPPIATIWLSAVVGSLVLSGFARYPLVDIWAASFALAGFYGLAVGKRWWWLSLAGVSLTVATNLRPSMIAPVLLAVAVLLVVRPKSIAAAVPAAAIAVIPQIIFNVRAWGLWSPVPRETGPLSAVQAGPAPYTLRYDTVAFTDRAPQQWFCDPQYAAILSGDERPHNQIQVLASALRHLPDSIWFLSRKVSANLHWSWATPYENSPDQITSSLTFVVIIISSLGLVGLIAGAVRARSNRRQLVLALAMLAFWLGALATVSFSTPETRFALPLVLVGLIGVISLVPEGKQRVALTWGAVTTVGFALALAVFLFAAGKEALEHDMPAGPLTDAAACAQY